jgi:O-antigen ligase
MLLFFWFAVKEKETFLRFLWVAVMLFGAGKTMRLLLYKYPNTIYSYDFVTNLILNTRISWILLIVLFVLALLLTVLKNKWNYPVKGMKWLCNVVFIVFGIVVVTIVCLIVLNAKGVLSQGMTARLSTIGYMNWGEEWGNGRGKTWAFTAEMFWEESVLHKLFGIGPDCYSAYATGLYQERLARIWPNNTLTNAHNEWFNMLINAGIIGAACYIGIFVSAVKRFTKAQDKTFMLITFSACIVSYMAYNFFCYQQVLCTPFIFMLIGMGEYIVRNE